VGPRVIAHRGGLASDSVAVNAPALRRFSPRTIVIFVAVVTAAFCVAGVLFGQRFFGTGTSTDAATKARAAAVAYLDAGQTGNLAAAYDQLCAQVRAKISREAFAARPQPFRSYEILGVRVLGQAGAVSTQVLLTDGTTTAKIIPVVEEDGTWRVCEG